MDYLDEKLRKRKNLQDSTTVQEYNYGKKTLFIVFGMHFAYVLGKLFVARHDVVTKTKIAKQFYRTSFPVYLFAGVINPLDNFCWEIVDGQIGFWQRIVFEDQNDEGFGNIN